MICPLCETPTAGLSGSTTVICPGCLAFAIFDAVKQRWKIYLPSELVPTSDWVDCQACDGSGWIECNAPWCSDPDHGGPCGKCHALGVVRGTLDHPTTPPPQEPS